MAYQWFRNGTPLQGENAAVFSLHAVELGQSDCYRVLASNEKGSVLSAPAALLVRPVGDPVPTDGFSSWQAVHFTPEELAVESISGPLGDASGDGVVNLVKYALGLDPREPAPGCLPIALGENGILLATYRRAKGLMDVGYGMEISSNLAEWETLAADSVEIVDAGDGREWVTHRLDVPEAARIFSRLRIDFPD